MKFSRVLLIIKDPAQQKRLLTAIEDWYQGEVHTAGDGEEGLGRIRNENFDIVIMDMIPSGFFLTSLLQVIKNKDVRPFVVVADTVKCQGLIDIVQRAGGYYYPMTERCFSVRGLFALAEEQSGQGI